MRILPEKHGTVCQYKPAKAFRLSGRFEIGQKWSDPQELDLRWSIETSSPDPSLSCILMACFLKFIPIQTLCTLYPHHSIPYDLLLLNSLCHVFVPTIKTVVISLTYKTLVIPVFKFHRSIQCIVYVWFLSLTIKFVKFI